MKVAISLLAMTILTLASWEPMLPGIEVSEAELSVIAGRQCGAVASTQGAGNCTLGLSCGIGWPCGVLPCGEGVVGFRCQPSHVGEGCPECTAINFTCYGGDPSSGTLCWLMFVPCCTTTGTCADHCVFNPSTGQVQCTCSCDPGLPVTGGIRPIASILYDSPDCPTGS